MRSPARLSARKSSNSSSDTWNGGAWKIASFMSAEAARPRRSPDRVDVHVVFDDAVGAHLELGLRIVGVPRARLDEARDAAGLQKPAELAQHGVGIRHVVERVEADDPIHAAVGQID